MPYAPYRRQRNAGSQHRPRTSVSLARAQVAVEEIRMTFWREWPLALAVSFGVLALLELFR